MSVRSTDFAGNQNETLNAAEIAWTDVPVDQVTSAVSLIAPVADSYSGELFFYASSIGGVSSVNPSLSAMAAAPGLLIGFLL